MNQNDNNRKDLEKAITKLSELLAATALQSKIVDELIKTKNTRTDEDEGFESASEGTDTPPTTPIRNTKAKSGQET